MNADSVVDLKKFLPFSASQPFLKFDLRHFDLTSKLNVHVGFKKDWHQNLIWNLRRNACQNLKTIARPNDCPDNRSL